MKSLTPDEESTQRVIVEGLRALGWVVRVTSRRAKKCPHCKRYSHLGDGADRGIADLLVRRPDWPRGRWCAIECKRLAGWKWSSKEQELAFKDGHFFVATSLEEAVMALEAA